jgi:uncharacterized protein
VGIGIYWRKKRTRETARGERIAMRLLNLPISVDLDKVGQFCVAHGVQRVSLFGSVLREDFDPSLSDVDVLIEFARETCPGWEFFGWAEDLSRFIGGKVDLHTPDSLSPHFREHVRREALTVYERT